MGGRTDEALVAATLAGEAQAFEELAARYRESVLALALRRLGRREEARDVAQAALVTAFTKLSALRDPSRFGPWLHKIAEALALNATRVTRREVSLDAAPHPFRAPEPGPERLLEQHHLTAQVHRSLAALSEATRRAVVLHYLDGHSQAEIAALLGLSAGAVKTRLSRARERLRRELAPEALPAHLRLALGPPRRVDPSAHGKGEG
jgi:RNA polymerase sigma-70 factor, ECF subfamily